MNNSNSDRYATFIERLDGEEYTQAFEFFSNHPEMCISWEDYLKLKGKLGWGDREELYGLFWFNKPPIQRRIELLVTNGVGYHNTRDRVIKLMQKTRREHGYKPCGVCNP